MTEENLKNIEVSLAIKLPDDYRRIALRYPIKFNSGKAEGILWDSADKVISENLRLRSKEKWPPHLFFIGDNGGGWQYAVDLHANPPIVVVVEFGDPQTAGSASYEFDRDEPTGVSEWFNEHLKLMRADGVNLDADDWPPSEHWTSQLGCAGVVLVFLIVAVIVAIFAVEGIKSIF